MATPMAPAVGAGTPTPDDDGERLGRRDLLVLKLELLRQRRAAASAVSAATQRVTRSTR